MAWSCDYKCDKCGEQSTSELLAEQGSFVHSCGGFFQVIKTSHDIREFQPYFDEKLGHIRTRGQEQRAMKKHGQIYTADTPMSNRVKEGIDKWKFRNRRGET